MANKTNDDATKPSPAEVQEAQKEGVLDAVRDAQTTQNIDILKGDEQEAPRFYNIIGTNLLEPLTGLGLEALKASIDPKKDDALSEEVIANLLILERNGPNRTDFVKLLMDRLKIKDIRKELPQAGGPDYTNDVTAVSKL